VLRPVADAYLFSFAHGDVSRGWLKSGWLKTQLLSDQPLSSALMNAYRLYMPQFVALMQKSLAAWGTAPCTRKPIAPH
jgi:hypothetical protein